MADGDPFDLDSAMDLDPDPAPPRPAPPRFQPKLKGKVKAEPSSNQEPAKSTTSTALAISTLTPMEEDDPEGDDPVVREIDVFCTHLEEDAQLYVMQYPLRPSWRPYELDERCEEVKVKPNNSEVELVLRMDVESENYDIDAPEPMRLRKQTLSSSTATSIVQCAAGILIKNQLHLNPIHGVLQFRPSINHINNDCGVQIKKHKTQEVDNKSDKGKLVIRDSSDHIDDEEPWVSLEYNPIGSTYSCKYQHKMMACLHDNIKFTMNPSEYADSLCPGTSTIKMKAKVPSSSFLPSFPLEDRLKEWLHKGRQVNRFDALMHLDSNISEEDFLTMLERHAFLVQGLWVSKSSLLFEGHEAQLRDYILFLFSENHVIKKSKLNVLRLNDDSLRGLLRPLAYERPTLNDWKFREERDSSFIKGHLEVVKEQEFAWLTRGKYLTEYLSKAGKVRPMMAKNLSSKMAKTKTAAQKVDTASNRVNDGLGSLVTTSMSNENRESLRKALLHIFRDRNARSINSIRRELRDLALSKSSRPKEDPKTKALVSAVAIAASGPSPDLLSVLKEVAVEIQNVYVLRSGENPALDPLRDVVLGLFCSKGANAKLKKQEIVEASRASLKRDIPDSEYKQVVNELCVYNKGAWLLKGVDNPE